MTTSMSPTQTRRRPESINTVATLKTGSSSTADNYCKIENAGIGPIRQIVITVSSLPVTLTDDGTTGSGSVEILNFPAGLVYVIGSVCSLTFSVGTYTDANFIAALGSAAAAADATLSSTEANFIPSTAAALTSGAGTFTGKATAVSGILDGTSTAAKMYLNIASSSNPGGNQTGTVSGTITMTYVILGDV